MDSFVYCRSARRERGCMAESGSNLAICALTSGLRLHVEGDGDLSSLLEAIHAGGLLPVQWERVGDPRRLNAQLVREARWAPPDAWLLARTGVAIGQRLQALRAAYGALPIVVLSTSPQDKEVAALAAGADAFCRWPEDAPVLPNRVHALLRRASGTFRVEPRSTILLVRHARQLHLADCVVSLSLPEYELLRVLDDARNQWVSNKALWHALGADNAQRYDSSALRMHVLRIRRKLGPWRWVLRTERGNGAMLTDQYHGSDCGLICDVLA